MSGVKRYYAPGLDFMWRDQKDAPRECIPMVLASDYDKLACMVEVGHKLAMDAACGEIAALESERDELRAQIEVMRASLEKISAYAPCSGIKDPGLTKMHMGILARDAIGAALKANP